MALPALLLLGCIASVLGVVCVSGQPSKGLSILAGLAWLSVMLGAIFLRSSVSLGAAIMGINGVATMIVEIYRPQSRNRQPTEAGFLRTTFAFCGVLGLIVFFGIIDFDWFGLGRAVGSALTHFSQSKWGLILFVLGLVWLPIFAVATRLGRHRWLRFLWPSLALVAALACLHFQHVI